MNQVQFSSTNHPKLSLQIVDQVRQAVISGKLKQGHRLPPEKEMLAQFGVSKHTLREALRVLESTGLVEIRPGAGGGAFVCKVGLDTTRDALTDFLHFNDTSLPHLSEVRIIFEPYLARKAAENFTKEDLAGLRKIDEALNTQIRRRKKLSSIDEEVAFHVYLGRSTGNPMMIVILDSVNNMLMDVKARLKPGPEFSEKVVQAHARIIEAIARHDGPGAEMAMRDHVIEVHNDLMALDQVL